MDDTADRRYFTQPTQTYHRQYEALRAVIVEGRPQKDVAEAFGFEYGSLRQLLRGFRRFRDADRESAESPFFETSRQGVPSHTKTMRPQLPQSRIESLWYSPAKSRCVSEPGRRVFSCSCRCWPNSDSIRSSARPATKGVK
jgi:hypothetical protein